MNRLDLWPVLSSNKSLISNSQSRRKMSHHIGQRFFSWVQEGSSSGTISSGTITEHVGPQEWQNVHPASTIQELAAKANVLPRTYNARHEAPVRVSYPAARHPSLRSRTCLDSTLIPLEIWDCPGNITVDTLGASLSEFSSIVFVIDIRVSELPSQRNKAHPCTGSLPTTRGQACRVHCRRMPSQPKH